MQSRFSDEEITAAFRDYDVALPELGSGGQKVAYRADRGGAEVVLKIVNEPVDSEEEGEDESPLRLRFERELRGMSAVDTPRVVKLLGGPGVRQIGSHVHLWYEEPFYGNGTLEDRLGDPWDLARVCALASRILEGIEALWAADLVHRDLKPANVAFDHDDEPVLLDLGIALHTKLTPITKSYQASPKTLIYAAPELFMARRDAVIDFRADLFQLGILMFEAWTGVHPFRSRDGWPDCEELIYSGNFDSAALNAREAAVGTRAAKQLKRLVARLLGSRPNMRFRTLSLARRALEEIR